MAHTSPQVSNAVIFNVVKRSSCFIRKTKTAPIELTLEPFNVTGENRAKVSGLANDKALSIKADGKALVVESKVAENVNKPSKLFRTSNVKRSNKRAINTINTVASRYSYRPDLRSAALARYARLRRSFNPKVGKEASRVRGATREVRGPVTVRRALLTE